MRVAQLVLVRAEEISFFEVVTLEAGTDGRGGGGFGSSGS
jgi:dUTPase